MQTIVLMMRGGQFLYFSKDKHTAIYVDLTEIYWLEGREMQVSSLTHMKTRVVIAMVSIVDFVDNLFIKYTSRNWVSNW